MKLYFYRKTIPPNVYDYYDYNKGIAGYKNKQDKGDLLMYGTFEDLQTFLDKRPRMPGGERRTIK